MSTRKPRGDAKLKCLKPELQAEIFSRCSQGKYIDVARWLKAEFNIRTSEGALSDFFSWYSLKQRMEKADSHVRNLGSLIDEHGLKIDPQRRKDTMNALFLTLASQDGDFETFEAAYKLILAGDKLDVEKRRVVLLEQKAAKADAADAIAKDGSITKAQRQQRIFELFGK